MIADTSQRTLGWLQRIVAAALLGASCIAAQAATLNVLNIDGPGIGFNDPRPVAPVGGNPGTTLGEQRQIVFGYAAEFWGRKLRSDVPIDILATFEPLPCTAGSGVLGAAGAYNVFSDFPNGRPATWYPSALANKLAGSKLETNPNPFVSADIISFFNGDIGVRPDCLTGLTFYLGLDGKAAPNQIDLLTTVLHEFGHGLGFQTFTDDQTGSQFPGPDFAEIQFPSIWDYFLLDPQRRKSWAEMNDGERVASAITPRNLVWSGREVTRNAHKVLNRGTPDLFVAGRGLNEFVLLGPANFGPPIDKRNFVSAPLARVVDQANGTGLACTPLDSVNAAAVAGKVAIIDRGSCAFTVKVKNAQLAGARAVLIADNAAGSPPLNLAGSDETITIPSARVTQDDGGRLKAAIGATPKGRIGPVAVLFENQLKLAGADYLQRLFMFTPNPNQPGSSVSHFDTLATPNLLMEPFATAEQAISVSPPSDLTLQLLLDIGW